MHLKNCNIIFSFNKASITDASIPTWILKTKGETYYVWHVESSAPWSTKETPCNPHTKGSISFKHVDLTINDNNCATISVAESRPS